MREPSPGSKSSSRLYGAGDGRFQWSPHPGSRVQAGWGLESATVKSGEHGRHTARSGAVVLDGLGDKWEMSAVR